VANQMKYHMKKLYSLFLLLFAGVVMASATGAVKLSLNPDMLNKAVIGADRFASKVQKAPAARADGDAADEPADEQWTLLGTGRFTDDIMSALTPLESQTWDVEIYESATTPGYYRVENPYGNGNCPYFDAFDSCDIFLHAENPDAVWVEYVELKDIDFGLMEGEYCPAYFCDYAGYYINLGYFRPEEAVSMGMASGKLLGGNFTFGVGEVFLDFPLFGNGDQFAVNLSGLLRVSLPGAKDFSFGVQPGDICTDSSLSVAYSAGEDIAEVKYGLFSGMRSFEKKDEKLFQEVLAKGSVATGGVVTVSPEYGMNTLALAALTADGDIVGREIVYCFGQQENADEWKTIGKAEYSEDVFSSIWPDEMSNVVYQVDVQESITTPGRYRLVDLYGPAYPEYQLLVNDGNIPEGHNHSHYVVIDATNPERVTIEGSPIGVEFDGTQLILFSEGWHSIQTGANLNVPGVLDGFGTLKNGKITFLGGAINLYMPGSAMYRGNINHKFYIQLPETDSVADVVAGTDAPVYYNVSGLRVDSPSVPGVYVKVQDGKATKVYVK